jgi:excinuclease UvrABC ATPase subunit
MKSRIVTEVFGNPYTWCTHCDAEGWIEYDIANSLDTIIEPCPICLGDKIVPLEEEDEC